MDDEEISDAERAKLLKSLWKSTPPELISLLPRYKGPKDTPKSQRQRAQCSECGVYHEMPAFHLKYMGHSDTTRLLAEVDPFWQWEPRGGWDENGEPVMVRNHDGYPVRMWINLTVLGVTRPGVGTVSTGKDDPEKELIGDAIRNAALRFGVGADLWSKAHGGDDAADSNQGGNYQAPARRSAPAPQPPPRPQRSPEALKAIAEWPSEADFDAAHVAYTNAMSALSEDERAEVKAWKTEHKIGWPLLPDQYEALGTYITVVKHGPAAPQAEPALPAVASTAACQCGSGKTPTYTREGGRTECENCQPF